MKSHRSYRLDRLHEDPSNPNKHSKRNLEAIAASLQEFGQDQPLVVQESTGMVIKGNGRLQAMHSLNWQTAWVVLVDDDKAKAIARGIADNRTAELATRDGTELARLLQALPEGLQASAGYRPDELEDLLKRLDAEEQAKTEAPYTDDLDYSQPAVTQPGDTWILGDHRVHCGDAFTDTAKVVGDAKVHVLFSDPPFGVNLLKGGGTPLEDGQFPIQSQGAKRGVRGPGGKATIGGRGLVKPRAYAPIIGDDQPFNPAPFLDMAPVVLLFGANAYASRLPDSPHWLVWDKHPKDHGQDALSFGDCELIWTNIQKRISVKVYRHHWTGLLREGPRKEEMQKRIHPTQKPVGLLAAILADYAPQGATVLDPFLGSGSTLIACEKTNRTCLGLELSPHYCDAIAKRWTQYTGKPSRRQSKDGKEDTHEW